MLALLNSAEWETYLTKTIHRILAVIVGITLVLGPSARLTPSAEAEGDIYEDEIETPLGVKVTMHEAPFVDLDCEKNAIPYLVVVKFPQFVRVTNVDVRRIRYGFASFYHECASIAEVKTKLKAYAYLGDELTLALAEAKWTLTETSNLTVEKQFQARIDRLDFSPYEMSTPQLLGLANAYAITIPGLAR